VESIFFEVNPSIKQFTDNAQRMSDQLQRSQQKESKKVKATKSVPIDSTDISTEADFMGGDLMGDMDPDQFRGRRSPSFQQREKDDDEEHKEPQEQKKEIQKLIDTIKSSGTKAPDSSAAPGQGEKIEGRLQPGYPTTAPEENKGSAVDGLAAQKERDGASDDRGPAARTSFPDAGDLRGEKVTRTGEKMESLEISKKEIPVKEERASTERPEDTEAQARQGTPVSLLSWGDEFIIADPAKKLISEEESVEAQEYESLEIPQDDDENLEASELIDDMLIAKPEEARKNRVAELFSPFGKRVLKLCRDFGSKIALLSPGETVVSFMPRAFYQDTFSTIRAGYIPEMKLCFFGEEYLEEEKPFVAPRFYFAHAFDNALGRDEFASLKSAAVLSNYRACQEREPGHQFLDLFSAASPVHYFAQAVESYLTYGQGEETLCSREDLYDFDRSMYLYVDYLFREINKEPPKHFGIAPEGGRFKP
jgi:hypothetical protein